MQTIDFQSLFFKFYYKFIFNLYCFVFFCMKRNSRGKHTTQIEGVTVNVFGRVSSWTFRGQCVISGV